MQLLSVVKLLRNCRNSFIIELKILSRTWYSYIDFSILIWRWNNSVIQEILQIFITRNESQGP